ncbi:MAG: Internalin-A precursor [Actinomycetota bacterium]
MRRFVIAAAVVLATFALSAPAQAYVTDGLYLSMDARLSDSYSVSNPGEWNDVSPNGRNGTIYGSVSLDAPTESLFFDGTDTGTNYVELDGAFDKFDSGMTIEFIGEFGDRVDNWERIFDFGNGPESDNIWVGRFTGTQELAFEVWVNTVNQGRCHTTTGGLAGRELAHWVITLDDSLVCRIYKDGVAQSTQLQDGDGNDLGSSTLDGTAYPAFPREITRTNNYVGRSNWTDPDFEGSIQMIRIYNRALTPDEVADNEANPTEPEASTGHSHPSKLAATGFEPVIPATVALVVLSLGFALRRRQN